MFKMDVIIQQKPCSRSLEIPGVRGVVKVPLGMEIPKGWGVQTKNLLCEGYGYFLQPHIVKRSIIIITSNSFY